MNLPDVYQVLLDELHKLPIEVVKSVWKPSELIGCFQDRGSSRVDAAIAVEVLEHDLRESKAVHGWLCRFNPYRGHFICERALSGEAIERLIEVKALTIRDHLLNEMENLTPAQYERFAVDLFRSLPWIKKVKGSRLSGDGGVDLEGVYRGPGTPEMEFIGQVKKWGARVGSPEVRDFVGTLSLRGPSVLGYFVATNGLTRDAQSVIDSSGYKIQVYDTNDLLQLMVEHQVGVRSSTATIVTEDHEFWTEIKEG